MERISSRWRWFCPARGGRLSGEGEKRKRAGHYFPPRALRCSIGPLDPGLKLNWFAQYCAVRTFITPLCANTLFARLR